MRDNERRMPDTVCRSCPPEALRRRMSHIRYLESGIRDPSAQARRSAFTLIELLTVIAIIGVVAALIVGIAGYATRKADRSRTMSDLQKYANALTEYRAERGGLPDRSSAPFNAAITMTTQVEGATTLWRRLKDGLPSGYDTSEIANQSDTWGNVYWYRKDSTYQFTLWSKGPSTLDDSDDITTGTGEM